MAVARHKLQGRILPVNEKDLLIRRIGSIPARQELVSDLSHCMNQAVPKDLSRPWEDPLAEAGERQLAQGLRGANLTAQEVPEWKQKAMGKAATLGIKDARPIKEQRESLPIFLLRDQLIEAVHANQVLVVIGETGAEPLLCFLSLSMPCLP